MWVKDALKDEIYNLEQITIQLPSSQAYDVMSILQRLREIVNKMREDYIEDGND